MIKSVTSEHYINAKVGGNRICAVKSELDKYVKENNFGRVWERLKECVILTPRKLDLLAHCPPTQHRMHTMINISCVLFLMQWLTVKFPWAIF